MSYGEHFAEHVRLMLLRILKDAPERSSNCLVLTLAAEGLRLPVTRDLVRTQLAWLEEQGLVKVERLPSSIMVATASERGLHVTTGRARVPGVQPPPPGF